MPPTSPVEPNGALSFERRFTKEFGGESPFDRVEWVTMDAWPDEPRYFVPKIRTPAFWSQNQLNIVSKLYLSKSETTPELDVQKMIERVAQQITYQGIVAGYYGKIQSKLLSDHLKTGTAAARHEYISWLRRELPDHPAMVFYDELCYILLHGIGAFNSPVWFNVGRDDRDQQVSACFILGAHDTTESLTGNGIREVNIFRGGSGAGKSLGAIRGSKEGLSGGGTASGPLSFMRADDAWAGTIKSGGKTRRAAKLVCLPADHPDIYDFVDAKKREEQRLRILAANGVHLGFDEEGERNVAEATSFQNANNSVTVSDEFMKKATGPTQTSPTADWELLNRTDGSVAEKIVASDLFGKIADAAHDCACPGLQFSDAMNRMHTTPMLDGVASPINSTNPCGEYMSNDDTSCNLASLNLMKFFDRKVDGRFRIEEFIQAVTIFTTAMDILVEFAYYPDDIIGDRTRKLRQLGLGYANMGAIIMANGWAYDSEEARDYAASISSLMTATGYRQSALMAKKIGAFHYYEENSKAMLKVIATHARAAATSFDDIVAHDGSSLSRPIAADASTMWQKTLNLGKAYGFRNAQASVIAPTGTISFLMACDTTGIEPGFSLVQYKELAGGGSMILVNGSVHEGLRTLGYPEDEIRGLEHYLTEFGTERFFQGLEDEHHAVFAGAGDISPKGHIKMMAAVQPFVSGSISKTINMDESATVRDVMSAYEYAWRLGVKDLAIYRNNSKARQVISAGPKVVEEETERTVEQIVSQILSDRLAETNEGVFDADPDVISERIYAAWKAKFVETETESFGPPEHDDGALERRRMPRTRQSLTHKIHVKSSLGENEGYIQVGMYPDGSPGELFVAGFGKHGGFTQNALSALATVMSIGLQYGIPLEVFTRKLAWVADETGGRVVPGDEPMSIMETKSIIDYMARWLIGQFGNVDQHDDHGVMTPELKARKAAELDAIEKVDSPFIKGSARILFEGVNRPGLNGSLADLSGHTNGGTAVAENKVGSTIAGDGPACTECGTRMRRTGGCFTCPSCGLNTGCG